MKIGIVTIHHVTNYGAVWQAYALSRFLAELGATVEIIDYRPPSAVKYYHQPLFKRGRPNIRRAMLAKKFAQFIAQHLPLSPAVCHTSRDLENAVARYDAIVAGSDQIWCTSDGSFRGYDSNFFLEYYQGTSPRKISYAASVGNTKTFEPHSASIKKALLQFSAIAVRDQPSYRLVEEATGQPPTIVLDPVFLHDFREFVDGVTPGNDLVIFADYPERFAAMARELGRRHGLRVIALGKPCSTADQNRRIVSPIDWLRAIKGAKLVLTDFFHGTAVSLRFGRPVIVSAPEAKTAKILDLLQRLDLSRHFLADPNAALQLADEMLANPQTFTSVVAKRVSEYRQRSVDYLVNALNLGSQTAPGTNAPQTHVR